MTKIATALACVLTAGVLTALASPAAAQQAYPTKSIRLISPNPPGGGTTAVARLIGQRLTEVWGHQVIIDNRPGANGFIGGEALAKASPDGHTMMVITNTHVITPSLYTPPYDPIKDFATVATLTKSELVLVVHPSVQANNLREFISLAKSKPGQLNYGSSGAGAITRLAGAFFDMMTGTSMQNISYKGSGQATADLLGGQVQLFFSPPVTVLPYLKSGRLRAIAVSGETRLSAMPQVATFTEGGLPGFDVGVWYGVLMPTGTQKAIVDKLSAELIRTMAMPGTNEKIAVQGMDPFISTAEQFLVLMKSDMAKYAKIIKTANIKADE